MDDELQQLEEWVTPLLKRLSATERRKVTRALATQIRRNQQQRMKKQEAPDGSKWAPRKSQSLRNKRGQVRRGAMFNKLRKAKYLRIKATPGSAMLYFAGRAGRIAAVHHHGLRAPVERGGPTYDYPARELLGISGADRKQIEDTLVEHLTPE